MTGFKGKIELKVGDLDKLVKNLKTSEQELTSIKKLVKNLGFKGTEKQAEGLSKKLQKVTDNVKKTSKAVGTNLTGSFNKASKSIEGLGKGTKDAGSFMKGLEKSANGINLDGIFSSLTGGASDSAGGLSKVTGLLGNIPGLSAGAVAGIGAIAVGIIAVGVAAFNAAEEFKPLFAQLENFGVASDDLSEFAGRIKGMSDTFSVEADKITQATNAVAKSMNITFDEALVKVEEGFLSGADAGGTYLSQLTKFGPVLAKAGISLEKLNKLSVAFTNEGVYGDKGLDAVKQATSRLGLNNAATQKAINLFSDNTKESIISAKATGDYSEAIRLVALEVQSLGTESKEFASKAIFGSTIKDAPNALKVISANAEALDALALRQGEFAAAEQESLEIGKKFRIAQAELGNSFTETGDNISNLTTTIGTFLFEIASLVVNVLKVTGVLPTLNLLMEALGLVIGAITDGLSLVNSAFQSLFSVIGSVVDAHYDLIDSVNGVTEAEKKSVSTKEELEIATVELTGAQDKLNQAVIDAAAGSESARDNIISYSNEVANAQNKVDGLTESLAFLDLGFKSASFNKDTQAVPGSGVLLPGFTLKVSEEIADLSDRDLRTQRLILQAKLAINSITEKEQSKLTKILKLEADRRSEAIKLAAVRRKERSDALRAEKSLAEARVSEEQETFDVEIKAGNFKGAEASFDKLTGIFKDLDTSIKKIEDELRGMGDISREELEKAQQDFKKLGEELDTIGTQYTGVVNTFISTDGGLTQRNPLLLALQGLVDTGKVSQEVLNSFTTEFTKDSGGLINVFTAVGKGIKVTDSSLLDFIKSIGVSGPLLTQLSQDGLNAFTALFEKFKSEQAALDSAEADFANRSGKRRLEEAKRETQLISLRRQRANLSKDISENEEALDNFTVERLNSIRDAAQGSNESLLELLLQLNRVGSGDALKDLELRQEGALDGITERALQSIQDVNEILKASAKDGDVIENLEFSIDPGTGEAFVKGFTDELRAANPEITKQLEAILKEYNLVLDVFKQEADNLPLIIADRIAQSVRSINRFALRNVALDLQFNKNDIDDAAEDLQKVIQTSLEEGGLGFNIAGTRAENDRIVQVGKVAIDAEKENFRIRSERTKLFHDDAIAAGIRANAEDLANGRAFSVDVSLLTRQRDIELENQAKDHSDAVVKITEETNQAVADNNIALTNSILTNAGFVLDQTSQLLSAFNTLAETAVESSINGIETQLSAVTDTITDATDQISTLTSDLEGTESGRREATLRGIELETQRREIATAKELELKRTLEREEKRQAGIRKANAIAQASINFALALTNVWANSTIPYPAQAVYGGVQSAVLSGIFAAELATIGNQKFQQGGILEGPSHAQGGIPFTIGGHAGFEAEGNEAIINSKSTQMFKPLLSAINEAGGGVKFQRGGITPANFAGISESLSGSQRKQINQVASAPVFVDLVEFSNAQRRMVQEGFRGSIN